MSSDQSDRVLGLGIDTGGTFTDAAIVDLSSNKVICKAKARTTHHDLSIGLGETIDSVLAAFDTPRFDPALVGVSTTLATNSILEGKGGSVGLIGLGWQPQEGWDLGAKVQRFLAGGHDVRGRSQAILDTEGIDAAVREMASQVDSIVVSGLFSVHNPYHEQEVAKMIRARYDGVPVVMGHQLTGELGIHERTVTAVLNARLIPVLSDFLRRVQGIMSERSIVCPLMVFKGDGTLMNIRTAMDRPVDTILSGPAASAMGGRVLSGLDDCVVIDMGGTSTDIAVLQNGLPKVTTDGSAVGKWRTRVEAVDMWTVGLGGDSEIRVSLADGLAIGPERVVPLCIAALRFPGLADRMPILGQCRFLIASPTDGLNLSPTESKIVEHLRKTGPQAPSELRRDLEEIILLDSFLKGLRGRGAIVGIGLTPTDVLHAAGLYVKGDVAASQAGVKLFSAVLRSTEEELIRSVLDAVTARIADELLRKLLSDEVGLLPDAAAFQGVMDLVSGKRRCSTMGLRATIDRSVVGLGAPAQMFIAPLEDLMNVKVVIPDDHDVGNAVGAVCGQVSEYVDVYVYPRDKGYAVYSTFNSPMDCGGEEEAVRRAKVLAEKYALERARSAGGIDLRVEIKLEEERGRSNSTLQKDELVQLRVRARAVGRPATSDASY